ncbi:MAG: hypothetical protein SF162_15880 [bacterium]|nr:hypothetical protein [bacterium]
MRLLLSAFFILLTNAHCTAAPAPTPTPDPCPVESAWGDVLTLARAGLAAPPALAVLPDQQIALAYVTSDGTGARQVMRRWINAALTEPITLTLPPIQPRAQTAFPALAGGVFVLWIDLDETSRQPGLFSALIAPTSEIVRGPLRLSAENERVYDYAAVRSPDGSLWVAWSGARTNEANLTLRRIDNDGRPGQPIPLAADALHPALIGADDGSLWVLYEQGTGDGVIRALVYDGTLIESARIAGRVSRTPGTLIHSLYAAADATGTGYLFWNLTRDDGRRETWLSTGSLTGFAWSPPELLPAPYAWARPLNDPAQRAVSAAVSSTEDQALGIVLFNQGQIFAAEMVTRCTPVIDPPALYASPDALILAWSRPRQNAPADLQITLRQNGG